MPQPRLRNVITLPSNVPKNYDDSITISMPRDLPFRVVPCPEGYDEFFSAMRFGELWLGEVKRRYPETAITFKGGPPGTVMASYVDVGVNFPNSRQVMLDVTRLANDLMETPEKWLLKPKDKDAVRLRKKLKPQEKKVQSFLGQTY